VPESVVATAPSREDVAAVADNFVTLMRSFNRARNRMLAAAQHDVEWSAHIILRCVANDGPLRASALAEAIQSDPSTVSRQVAALVKEGLLERRADQGDGRASLLVVTDSAHAVLAEHDEIKLNHFAEMLDGWSPQDLRSFAAHLARFNRDFEHTSEHNSISEKVASRARSAGRNG
jgi:DNA-binding MarR family transcriptional regulator